MKHPDPPQEDSWENDPVWKLLEKAPPPPTPARFVDDTVRAARLAAQPASWWLAIMAPAPKLAGLSAIAAAVALALTFLSPFSSPPAPSVHHSNAAIEIEEIAETETLIAAVDHLDQFSDTELVTLIGF